ncbi:twitching motility protein pilT [Secundilactobacillus pentosiphilus]|uniref:Twitching motility protein pilT n=1 Tax=Secundilactobacillus pentosiphilus TaxID=1714682 RepID=A0A1Z5IXF5_9LACO|nr:PIN/TRAM domain-containing protein [Secundilactobacillus pentosiphilus]GAX03264.1 twitching motility protein pilT [Secundilactobacillus pentosiphilus]GAX06490.1 twitching motility protein pilT [Secundilactobacillus pentosiphilus]
MNKKRAIIQGIFAFIGIGLGVVYLPLVWAGFGYSTRTWLNNEFTNAVIGALLFWLLSLVFSGYIERLINRFEKSLTSKSPAYLLFGSISTIVGLVFAILISTPLYRLNSPIFSGVVPIILMILFGWLGFRLGTTKRDEWRKLFTFRTKKNEDGGDSIIDRPIDENYHHYKILDTNILIDGRIYDLVKTGFIEGTLLVPNFVLYELQYIADSSDSIKRVRGRRGLDILNKLREENIIPVEMYEGDYDDISEVDSKLIRLAKEVDGVIVTNDYNLNKVIEFQKVQVLNINALANALKPRVIPGEHLDVMVVKNGTERQQGVAYLDDGTMVVVEDGRFYLNEHLDVIVTSAIQTDAGRMIFAKPAHSTHEIDEENEKNDNAHQNGAGKQKNNKKKSN